MIRLAEIKDLDCIKKAYQELDHIMMGMWLKLLKREEECNEEEELHTDTYWMDLIEKKTGYILVSELDDKVVGVAVIEKMDETECHLEDLYVFPEYRKNGIGKQLIKEAKCKAKEQKYERMSLNVLANNENAFQLYKELQFDEIKVNMSCQL